MQARNVHMTAIPDSPTTGSMPFMLFAKWVALVMLLTVYSRRPGSTIRPGRHSNSPARPPKCPRGTRTGTEESRTGPPQSRNRPVRPSRRTSTSADESTGQASASDGQLQSASSRPTTVDPFETNDGNERRVETNTFEPAGHAPSPGNGPVGNGRLGLSTLHMRRDGIIEFQGEHTP